MPIYDPSLVDSTTEASAGEFGAPDLWLQSGHVGMHAHWQRVPSCVDTVTVGLPEMQLNLNELREQQLCWLVMDALKRDPNLVQGIFDTHTSAMKATLECAIQTNPKRFKGNDGEPGIVGDRGPQGPQGQKGERGIKGDRGVRGDAGDCGVQGDKGPSGVKGDKGLKGDRGDCGNKGATGNDGGAGHFGPAGPKGTPGDAGAAGMKGYAGSMGPRGQPGQPGSGGQVGPAGSTGAIGAAGPKGETGAAGPKGDTGTVGPTGETGAAGPKGETGAVGPKGEAGAVGPKGETGLQGPAGAAGEDAVIQNVMERVVNAGGRQALVDGSLSISLSWENTDFKENDMDLWVTVPGGQKIWWENHNACGGTLDVDRQESARSPVENVVFEKNAPKGTYRVEIQNYGGNTKESVPCVVVIKKNGGQAEVFNVVVSGAEQHVAHVTTFDFL